MNSGDKDAIEAIISHNGAKIHTNLSSPWRENPNRRKSVGDESPNGPVSGSFSYIFALVSLHLGIEYICGQSQYLRRLLWLQNSFESTTPRPIAGKKALF